MSKTIKGRNPFAVAAFNRHSERFAHKNKGRGGARNEQRDLIEENYAETDASDAADADAREDLYAESVLAQFASDDEEYGHALRADQDHARAPFEHENISEFVVEHRGDEPENF